MSRRHGYCCSVWRANASRLASTLMLRRLVMIFNIGEEINISTKNVYILSFQKEDAKLSPCRWMMRTSKCGWRKAGWGKLLKVRNEGLSIAEGLASKNLDRWRQENRAQWDDLSLHNNRKDEALSSERADSRDLSLHNNRHHVIYLFTETGRRNNQEQDHVICQFTPAEGGTSQSKSSITWSVSYQESTGRDSLQWKSGITWSVTSQQPTIGGTIQSKSKIT